MAKRLMEEVLPWETGKSEGSWMGKGEVQARMAHRQCPAEEYRNEN